MVENNKYAISVPFERQVAVKMFRIVQLVMECRVSQLMEQIHLMYIK